MSKVDDELTARAIRAGLEVRGMYQETIHATDGDRARQLRRIGQEAADRLGVEVGIAGVSTRDHMVRVCIIVARTPAQPEPV